MPAATKYRAVVGFNLLNPDGTETRYEIGDPFTGPNDVIEEYLGTVHGRPLIAVADSVTPAPAEEN